MIYFDNNKQAYTFEIPNYTTKITDELWNKYNGTNKWDIINNEFVDISNTEEYKKEKLKETRKNLDNLSLTPSDVERALYKAKSMDFDDLKLLISEQLKEIDIKSLNIEFRAKDFYRGATYKNIRLFDTIGELLGYTPEDMDFLFINKELPLIKDNT